MLTQIELENFKVFKEKTSFLLGQITLLTGINACGKSTLLQSLLLMRQSIEHNDSASQVVLNGSCVNLGSFTDIKNSSISRNESIKFIYHYEDQHILNPNQEDSLKLHGYAEYDFEENFEDDMVAQISNITFSDQGIINFNRKKSDYGFEGVYKKIKDSNILNLNRFDFDEGNQGELPPLVPERTGSCRLLNLLPFYGEGYDFKTPEKYSLRLDVYSLHKSLYFYKIHYISADRLGPQEFYPKATLNKFPNVGAKGEFTVNLLYKKRDDLINEKLCLGQDAKTLYTQTEEWLNEIFNGAKVEIPSSDSNTLELLFNTSNSKERFKPANVGFGYHCILPIVVSGLIAQPGEILIVENPEAHLHPRAQSRLAQFLARVSSCGVQVFIESHSDHILNALRIAVLDKIVTPDDLRILYFKRNPEQPVVQIPVQPNGGIEEWPEGFFDQMDKDFSRLFGM
jgi:predicted ATPase